MRLLSPQIFITPHFHPRSHYTPLSLNHYQAEKLRQRFRYRSNCLSEMSSRNGKEVSSGPDVNQLTQGVSGISLDAEADSGGWETYAKKPKGKAGSGNKQWGSNSRGWGQPKPNVPQKSQNSGAGSGRGSGSSWPSLGPKSGRFAGRGTPQQSMNPASNQTGSVALPLKHGWDWASRSGSIQVPVQNQKAQAPVSLGEVDDDNEPFHDSDDDDFDDDYPSDDFDSDSSVKSHETRKKNRLLKELFECMDGLTAEQMNDADRQWHCPACKGGPGAIDWYRGLRPLIAHAKTKGAIRVKLHRELAQLLEEELRRRGTFAGSTGEMFGQWHGLDERMEKDIVWPPMVMIMNTRLDQDEKEMWTGMGSPELLDYFSSYAAIRAKHSYGPQGHRGVSVLIFEASAVGYLEAERLSKHFEFNSRDRKAWEQYRVPYYSGGKRQLYGYMAQKKDLDHFNQHCQGKQKLKYDICSYQKKVVEQLKHMSEDNQQLQWVKNKLAKEQRHSKAVEESLGLVSEQYRKTYAENRLLKLRTKMHHKQNKEEMDYQEQFFTDELKKIHDARNAKEDDFEKIQQEKTDKMKQDPRAREEEKAKSVTLQGKEMEEFVGQRELLVKEHDEKMEALKNRQLEEEMALRQRHQDEIVALEREFDTAQGQLMAPHMP